MALMRQDTSVFYDLAGWAMVLVPLIVAVSILGLSFPLARGMNPGFLDGQAMRHPVGALKSWMYRNSLNALNDTVPGSFKDVWDIATDGACRAQSFRYFKRVMDVFPQGAEAQGVLAVCRYYAGQESAAEALWRKAAGLQADYFWVLYDLGVVAFRRGDYDSAHRWLQRALAVDFKKAAAWMMSSKIYQQIIRLTPGASVEKMLVRLQGGYRRAGLILMLIQQRQSVTATGPFPAAL